VLAGDRRLEDGLRREELAPLGSRVRVRIKLEALEKDDLLALLAHRLQAAGGQALLTPGLKTTLAERAAGNPRVLLGMAQELLMMAAHHEKKQLDEKLFLEVYGGEDRKPRRQRRRA
ncbi:MAG: hypothetical protein ACC662_11485, partial [Planctomycetota bacterium]